MKGDIKSTIVYCDAVELADLFAVNSAMNSGVGRQLAAEKWLKYRSNRAQHFVLIALT